MPADGGLPPCRVCGRADLELVLSLGDTPVADVLCDDPDSHQDPRYPLDVAFSPTCGLLQLVECVPRERIYNPGYAYYSSVSPSLLEHFRRSAEALIEACGLGSASLVVEAASNDGYMLRTFAAAGVPVLGIEPSAGPAARARALGIETREAFFDRAMGADLAAEGLSADLFLANNVLAHVPDPRGFVGGIAAVLKPGGLAVLEIPYVVDLVDRCEFDTIYHQHLCYFSVTALVHLFAAEGLTVYAVERTPIHGGSLRLWVRREQSATPTVEALLAEEQRRGVDRCDFFADFGDRAGQVRDELIALLQQLKADGNRLAGYGAAAKATTLMAFAGIDHALLDYVVDSNAVKQGRYMGGNHLPIVSPQILRHDPPDYLLLLAWNWADEIMAQQQAYADAGGRFILPLPEPHVVAYAA